MDVHQIDGQPDRRPANIMPLTTYCWQRKHKKGLGTNLTHKHALALPRAAEP